MTTATDRPPGSLPVVLCIDIEPDPRTPPVPCADPWLGFELLLAQIEPLRQLIERTTGRPARLNWFLRADPQIEVAYGSLRWGIDRYRGALDRLAEAGDELGVHPHSWRWRPEQGGWLSDQADPEWVANCARCALETFAEAFGRPCRAYRHGDRYWSDALWALIADAGVTVDLTPEPGMPMASRLSASERATGWIPHLPGDRHQPFIARRSTSALVSLPLTTVPRAPAGHETLLPWRESREFRQGLDERLGDPRLHHLAFAIRSDLPRHPPLWRNFIVNLGTLARLPGATFLPAQAVADRARTRLVPG